MEGSPKDRFLFPHGSADANHLRAHPSVADSLNEGLRARRTGKSYDYLAGEGDEQRRVPPKKFAYHDAAPAAAPGKSFDYMDGDQNRKDADGYGGSGGALFDKNGRPHRYYDIREVGFEPAAFTSSEDDTDVDSEDEEWVQQRMAERPIAVPAPRKTANPGPIGLLGFGMTTILLNLHNTGHWPLFSVVPAMGICYGGGAQLAAGLLEFTKGNTFAYCAFTSYGAFWLSLVCIWMLPNSSTDSKRAVQPTTQYFLGVYLIIWGFFSFLMMCCTIRMNLAIFLVFFTVTLLFFLLGGANMAGNVNGVKAAGYEGIVCGCLAIYLALAEIINEVWDRTILPIFPMTQVIGWFQKKKD